MGKLPRKTAKRLWYCGLLILWLLPFTLAAIASAEGAYVTADGQGWYWKSRPRYAAPESSVNTEPQGPVPGQNVQVGGDVYCYQVPGSPCSTQWRNEHIYVGWDGQSLTPEAIGAVHFELNSIPPGSTITRFTFTIKQHPAGTDHNHTPNYDAPAKHGVVVCPWPDFYAGPREGPDYLDPETKEQRECGDSIRGTPSRALPTDQNTHNHTIDWTFDLSSVASEWTSEVNPGISIEPETPSASPVSWMTSFHFDTVFHNPTTGFQTSPNHSPGDIPGLSAEVTYLLPTGELETGVVSGEFGSEFDPSGDPLAFGDSGGLSGDLGATSEPPEAPKEPQLAAGVFEGRPAGFWAYPIAWFAAFVGFILLGFAGKILQADPGHGRPPGAAAALMRGGAASG